MHEDDLFTWQLIEDQTKLPLDASFRKLGVKGRVNTLLQFNGMQTVGDLLRYTQRHTLDEIGGLGPKLQKNLRERMAEAGHPLT